MKNLKKITALLLALVMILGLAACGGSNNAPAQSNTQQQAAPAADSNKSEAPAAEPAAEPTYIDKIKEAGVLKLGTSADYPPYEFHTMVDGQDKIVGFEIAMAQKMADDLGVELEITDMGFDALLISLQKGDFDLVMAGMSDTEERRQSASFSDNIFSNQQIVIIRKADEDKYVDIESLKGVSVGAQTGTTQVQYATEALGTDKDIIQLTKLPNLIMELKAGKIEAVFTNSLIAQAYTTTNDDLVVKDIGLGIPPTGFAIAVQKGNDDLLAFCNEELAAMKAAGLVDQYIAEAEVLAGMTEAE